MDRFLPVTKGCNWPFRPVTTNRLGLFFTIAAVFFEQVYLQENIHAEIDEGVQANLEGCLRFER
jgi:hypothetical protein